MTALTINTGSSSVRLAAFAPGEAELRACGEELHGLCTGARRPGCCSCRRWHGRN